MPIYEFKCPRCGVTAERQKKIADMDKDPPTCVECNQTMQRVVALVARHFPGASNWHR